MVVKVLAFTANNQKMVKNIQKWQKIVKRSRDWLKTISNGRQMNNCPNNFYFKHCIVFLNSYKVVLNLNGSPLYQKSHTHYKNRDYLENEWGCWEGAASLFDRQLVGLPNKISKIRKNVVVYPPDNIVLF